MENHFDFGTKRLKQGFQDNCSFWVNLQKVNS